MTTYLITEVEWHNAEKSKEYHARSESTLERYGGKTLGAGPVRAVEGEWHPPRVVLVEFPNMDSLQAWYRSEEYAPLLRLRHEGAITAKMAAVDLPKR
jgi:uncharacterized protein (DUF1330 family)